jgi:2-desacetyl-2-hydroxyethyl bacteriochlorophyllide A dehydrogenase
MRAAVLEAVNKLVVQDIPVPSPGPNEVLIKVEVCGICGTDLKLYHGDYSANMPVVLGHEYVGEVVEAGADVVDLKAGDKVVSDPNESCGACYWCRSAQPCFCNSLAAYGVLRDGGFADYCTAEQKGVYPIPEGLDFDSAAFTEPVSCAVHAADRIQGKAGENVVIIGGGPMGQLLLQFARHSGANKVIVSASKPAQREMAERFGADAVINPQTDNVKQAVLDLTDGLGADVVVEAVGRPSTIEQAIEAANASFSPFDVLSKELTILGSWVNPYTYSRALDMLASGKVDVKPLITNRLGLDDILDGFEMMANKPQGFVKALVEIGGGG